MNEQLRVLPDAELPALSVEPAGVVDLRRDLYRFVSFVREKGLRRTRVGNNIPKTAARQLAKLLSWPGEAQAVEEEKAGYWSAYVSEVALALELVRYDTKGVYVGYSSREPAFIDNDVEVNAEAWDRWLAATPVEKERAILDAVVEMTGSEFFRASTLVSLGRFHGLGSATGPAGRMDLPAIRRGLLELLAELQPERWYEFTALVELVQRRVPHLILDPTKLEPDVESSARLAMWEREVERLEWEWKAKRRAEKRSRKGAKTGSEEPPRPPRPPIALEDIYVNFRESPPGDRWRTRGTQIASAAPDAFRRVEGRYLERFLCEVPLLCGFVALAFRGAEDPHGLDVHPPLERLRAVRLTERLAQVVRGDAGLNAVTVRCLPTFEVLVHAPSYPDRHLERLAPLTKVASEDGPSHRLELVRAKITERAAKEPAASPAATVLTELCDDPVPGNVAAELASWESRGEKVVVYEGLGLLELDGSPEHQRGVLAELGDLVVDGELEGMAVVRDPEAVFELLEQKLLVPVSVTHPAGRFAQASGRLAPPGAPGPRTSKRRGDKAGEEEAKKLRVVLEPIDLVAYRVAGGKAMHALVEAVKGKVQGCLVLEGERLLLVPAAELPELRKALRGASGTLEVELGT